MNNEKEGRKRECAKGRERETERGSEREGVTVLLLNIDTCRSLVKRKVMSLPTVRVEPGIGWWWTQEANSNGNQIKVLLVIAHCT